MGEDVLEDWQTVVVAEPDTSTSLGRRGSSVPRSLPALVAGLAGALVAIVQLRHGIIPLLDTATYWSGGESVASGRIFGTTLAPSFSNFDAIEFLERNGRLPFVDFPVLYPLLSGSIGAVVGTRAAMHALAVVSLFAICCAVATGIRSSATGARAAAAAFAILVSFLPAMRLVTQGALSEPLFIASTLLFVVYLARFRNGGAWLPVAGLVVVASLLRFLGAPLALLAGWEYFGRTRNAKRTALWTVAMAAPAAANIAAAAAAGGGHSAGWRGLDRMDIDVFVRSIGGWLDADQGDLRRTYFTTDGPAWWSWIAACAAIGAMTMGVLAVLRRRRALTDTADLALSSAAILTAGLVAGILGFDALVIADNRLMLPAGILVSSAVVWWMCDCPGRTRIGIPAVACIVLVWAAASARPWNVLERFSDITRPSSMSLVARELGVDIVISNDADAVHWDTGIAAAYTPMKVKPLTGEIVDDREVYLRLPCALLRANGAVVISNEATFSVVDREALDEAAERGRLERLTTTETTAYLPTANACDE